MIVIKRDGQEVNYNRSKIIVAIGKANEEVPEEERISNQEIEEIVSYVETRKRKRILVDDIQDIIDAAKTIHANGVEIVAVSLGADGSLAVGEEGIFRAIVPKIDAVNTVGCGDSMIAGYALGLSEGLSLEETLRRASAISAAAAMREETGFFVMEDMEKLLPQIVIQKLYNTI